MVCSWAMTIMNYTGTRSYLPTFFLLSLSPFRVGYVVVFQDFFVFLLQSPLTKVASCHLSINPLRIEHILYTIMVIGRIKCTKIIW